MRASCWNVSCQMPLMTTLLVASMLAVLKGVFAVSPGFPYGSTKVRGVNLGGWLVLEPWITPSLFDNTGNPEIIDEYTFGKYLDYDEASATLQDHWDTFITEKDFVAIHNAGLNHVRIPIGYWAFDVSEGEPYIQGQLPYLRKAVTWASNHDIKVIVDLHGVPGSQNGFDNSGQKMDFPNWQISRDNIDRTNAVLKTIVSIFKDQSNVVPMIEPLNEPAGYRDGNLLDTARQYWLDSYGNIRYPYGSAKQSNTVELFHDAFQTLEYWNGFLTGPEYQGVAIDTHIYQVFSNQENARSESDKIDTFCARGNSLAQFDLWAIVGEWTPAVTDCALYLNGRGVGSRFDGSYPGSPGVDSCEGKTGSGGSLSTDYKILLRKTWEAQVITYERGAGWIMWTWKTENAADWSYQAGLKGGWIPKDVTSRKYPGICDR